MNLIDLESQIRSDPFNPLLHIALAKAYLEGGDEERARKIVAIKRRLPSKDSKVHFEWGRLCEELGMSRQARESYEEAIALDPDNPDNHFRLALLCQEKGAWERTLKHLQKTVSLFPQHAEAKEMLASLYEEIGLKGSALAVHEKKREGDSVFHAFPFDLTEDDINLFLDLFKGKEFGYATYHLSKAGLVNHTFVKGVLGFGEVYKHLRGEETYGVYPLRGDRTLKFTCVHVAIPWRKVLENIKNEGFLTLLEQKVHQYVRKILEKSREMGIPVYLEDSGERDRRAWFFFEEFLPAELADRFLNAILDGVPAPPSDTTLTLLMGVKGKGIGQEEHPIMLPLGFNRRTARRCFFVNEYGDPYEDQLLWIKKIRLIGRAEAQGFCLSAGRRKYRRVQIEFDPLKRLIKSCPVIDEICRKAQSGRMLSHEEKLVIFFTLGFLKDNFRSLHHFLEPCPDYRPKKVERLASRLKSNPISCPKIRELLPDHTAYLPCNCYFNIPEGGYPNPLLHIDPRLVPHREDRLSMPGHEEVLKEYQDLNKRIEELTKRRNELESILRNIQF
ncbi:MAG: tetratricopeptide repeat protein [Syntrophaceae bacterium]|nr:tetratricopeptide repeat protein [Syntrophaceae bacterium]